MGALSNLAEEVVGDVFCISEGFVEDVKINRHPIEL